MLSKIWKEAKMSVVGTFAHYSDGFTSARRKRNKRHID